MGVCSKNNRRRRSRAKSKFKNSGDVNCETKSNELRGEVAPSALPCVAKLYSSDWSLVEEGCADVAGFALQPKQHENLIANGVLPRLVELLFTPHRLMSNNNKEKDGDGSGEEDIHRGVVYLQTAAAEALRNLIVNGPDDVVVDALVTAGVSAKEQQDVAFSERLVELFVSTWETVEKTRLRAPFVIGVVAAAEKDGNGEREGETEDEKNLTMTFQNTSYMAATRLLDEILQLIAVCVEGNELIAESFSTRRVIHTLLSLLASTTGIVWDTLQDAAEFYTVTVNSSATCMRQYKRHEAELLATVAASASEVLHVLSGDNEALASLMQSTKVMASHQEFLTNTLDATAIMTWLREESLNSSVFYPLSSFNVSVPNDCKEEEAKNEEEEDSKLLFVSRQNILYQLCEVCLRIQGTLLNTAPNPTNVARVLPLVVAVLDAHPPHMEWRRTVPLLLQECAVLEEHRKVLVTRAIWRLRCDQTAVTVLHAVVDTICGLNNVDMDDETAFSQNPHANLLYSSQAMYVVGKLMKDALQLLLNENGSNNGASSGVGDVFAASLPSVDIMNNNNNHKEEKEENDVVVEQALRAAAGTSGFGGLITKLQLLVLSNEVGVWSLANTLLMMVPWSGLGEEPFQIWRAIISALNTRAQLLAQARATANNDNKHSAVAAGMASLTPAALTLLRLQVESLVQMLWTLQRKQTSQAGDSLHVTNALAASPTDVDVITRLAWDSSASLLQRQACVAVVCSLCISFKNVEAIKVATHFALGVLQLDHKLQAVSASAPALLLFLSSSSSSLENKNTNKDADDAYSPKQWGIKITAVDAQWRVRCEAANNIMDLFLDETYDETVYIPLSVHSALRSFLVFFRAYISERQQVVKDTRRTRHIVLPGVNDIAHWREVVGNLGAFIKYKEQQIGVKRLF